MIRYGFLDPFIIEPLDKELVMTKEAVRYRSSGHGKWPFVLGRELVIPAGFICNGASYPTPTLSFLPPKMEVIRPAFLHDLCYRVGPSFGVNRRSADWLMLEAMKLGGDGDPWQREAIWRVLRLFGGRAWHGWRKLGLTVADSKYLTTYDPRGLAWTISPSLNY